VGGMDWGGLAFDPSRNLIIVNSNNVIGAHHLAPHQGSDGYSPLIGTPYRQVYDNMMSIFGAPCNAPPWGRLTAINITTGKKVWEVPLGTSRDEAPWPLWFHLGVPNQGGAITTASGLTFIAATTDRYFRAFETATGKELWRVEDRAAHSGSATPVVGKDLVYFQTGHGKPELWAVKPGGHGVLDDSLVVWKVKKNVPTRSSTVLVNDLLYMVDDGGIASCIDAKTGADVWRKRIGGNYSAAPLYADGRIYFFSEEGKATAIAPGRELKILGESQLDGGFMASPAVSDHALILRTKTHLYRVENK